MKRTLVVATTSYAGMGPYVSEIVNTFSPDEEVYFFLTEHDDLYYHKNVKNELFKKCVFYLKKISPFIKLKELLTNRACVSSAILDVVKKNEIQVVHFISGPGPQEVVKALNNKGIRVISTVHDLYQHEYNKSFYKAYRQNVLYKRQCKSILFTNDLITNSNTQFVDLKYKYPQKNVFFHEFPSLVTEKIKLGDAIPQELVSVDKPFLLFFGRLEAYKGVELLYKVFEESSEINKNYHLVIAGKGDVPFQRISNEVEVSFINRYINDEEVSYLYKNATVVVYPYISATQSGVLSLAFYFGTPVLASDVPFFRDTLDKIDKRLIFVSGSESDLSFKLSSLLNYNKDQIRKIEREYYDSFYDGRIIHNQLVTIYNI